MPPTPQPHLNLCHFPEEPHLCLHCSLPFPPVMVEPAWSLTPGRLSPETFLWSWPSLDSSLSSATVPPVVPAGMTAAHCYFSLCVSCARSGLRKLVCHSLGSTVRWRSVFSLFCRTHSHLRHPIQLRFWVVLFVFLYYFVVFFYYLLEIYFQNTVYM